MVGGNQVNHNDLACLALCMIVKDYGLSLCFAQLLHQLHLAVAGIHLAAAGIMLMPVSQTSLVISSVC